MIVQSAQFVLNPFRIASPVAIWIVHWSWKDCNRYLHRLHCKEAFGTNNGKIFLIKYSLSLPAPFVSELHKILPHPAGEFSGRTNETASTSSSLGSSYESNTVAICIIFIRFRRLTPPHSINTHHSSYTLHEFHPFFAPFWYTQIACISSDT